MLDMLIIEDADVANTLIDMSSIEQIILIPSDEDAQKYMSNRNLVPHNCKFAITKEGYTYHPDPNYRSYAEGTAKSRLIQVSVKDAIR